MSISRAEFLKLAGFSVASLVFPRISSLPSPSRLQIIATPGPSEGEPPYATPDGPIVTESGLILDDRTAIALAAAEAVVRSMPGKYSWEEYRTCSTFISAYLGELGLPISDKTEKAAASSGLFPWSGTLRQVSWLRENLPKYYVRDAPLIDFLRGQLWGELNPGKVIYLTRPGAFHNGYDTYYHVAALVGYHIDGEPQFAELAVGMRNPSAEHTFQQLTRFYKRKANGSWDTTPSDSRHTLIVTWFDPFEVIRDLS